jgi:hypothetical protein
MEMNGYVLGLGRFIPWGMSSSHLEEAGWDPATDLQAVTKEKLSTLPGIESQFSLCSALASVSVITWFGFFVLVSCA